MPTQETVIKKDLSFIFDRYIAHRGYHNQTFPENTLGAYKLAIENNFNIELDLQLTKDNKVVVFHDDEMTRLTGVSGRICDNTYEELLKLRILGSDQKIPLFSEVLQLVNGKVGLVVELKTCKDTNNYLPYNTIELLKDYNGKYCIMSFDPFLVKRVRQIDDSIIRGQLVCKFDKKSSFKHRFMFNNLFVNLISKPDYIDTEFHFYPKKLRRLHKKYPVICWTVRSKEDQKIANKFDNITFEKFDPRGE